MTILLQWLIDYTWLLYPVCAIGFVVYVIRALSAQRERGIAQFTIEREIATSHVVQAWAMALVFVVIGAVVFASTTFIFPKLDLDPFSPTPTLEAGLEITTPTATPAPSPTSGFSVPTFSSTAASTPAPTSPPPQPTETPAPDVPEPAVTGDVNVRFGDFARLLSYGLPAREVATAQPLLLTLQWQSLDGVSPADYWVFTHLLAEDGRLIAQHDGVPAGGTKPTTAWGSGEIILDLHAMTFYDPAYTGPATIVVGMYDPGDSATRVPTELGNDYVVLPITLDVTP